MTTAIIYALVLVVIAFLIWRKLMSKKAGLKNLNNTPYGQIGYDDRGHLWLKVKPGALKRILNNDGSPRTLEDETEKTK